MGFTILEPRMRVSKSTSLTLSTAWQKLIFDGTDTLNINTFGKDPTTGNPMVMWDTTNNMFKFYNPYDTNYKATFFLTTTVTAIATRASVRYRCVVPNGVSAGVNLYYPFTSSGGYADIIEVTIVASTAMNTVVDVPLYLSDAIRVNGMWVEVMLSNSIVALGVATLSATAFLIQASK